MYVCMYSKALTLVCVDQKCPFNHRQMAISDNSQHETMLITYFVGASSVFSHEHTMAPHSFYMCCAVLQISHIVFTVQILQPKFLPPAHTSHTHARACTHARTHACVHTHKQTHAHTHTHIFEFVWASAINVGIVRNPTYCDYMEISCPAKLHHW